MGGKGSKQTIGYKYYLGQHLITCHGPIDAITQFRVDERMATQGYFQGGAVVISAESLFGGEKREGGVSGTIDVEMGYDTQGQNSYLVAQLGATVPGYRGVVGLVFRQCYLGNNPYLKRWAFRGQRIQVRQDGLAQWYPSRAPIGVEAQINPTATYGFNQLATNFGTTPSTTYTVGRGGLMRLSKPRAADSGGLLLYDAWSAWPNDSATSPGYVPVPGQNCTNGFEVWASNNGGASFTQIFATEDVGLDPNMYAGMDAAYEALAALMPVTFTGWDIYRVQAKHDNNPSDNRGGISLLVQIGAGTLDMNPAHMIRECLTDPDWGMGYQDADIDDTSFTAAANTLLNEGLGMSLLWDKQTKLEDFVMEIVKHIDAALYVSRTTGKFVLKLIRGDYDEGSLITLDESNIAKVTNPTKPTFGELANSVTVNYWDAQTGKDASLTLTDTAMVQMQGQVIGTTVQYPGFTNARNATIVGQRDLRSLSSSFLSCTIYADSTARNLNIGDTFKFSWAKWQIADMVMRVTGLAFGDGKSNQVRVTCAQDVFDTPTVVVVTNPGGEWVDPSSPPGGITDQLVFEAPYYELVQALGQADIDSSLASKPDISYVMAGAGRAASAINANLWTDDGTGFETVGVMDFCPTAELASSISKMATSVLIANVTDGDLVEVGQHVQIGNELCRVDAIDTVAGTMTIGRGCLDTVPEAHTAGDLFFFWDLSPGFDPTEYVEGESVAVRITAVSGQGQIELADALEDTVVLAARAFRPYPPGQFKINGVYYTTDNLTGSLTITFTHRDRKQQTSGTIFDHTYGDIGPEAGTTYRLQCYIDGGLVDTVEPFTSGSTYDPPGEGTCRIEIHSKRDGEYSLQAANHEFIYTGSDPLVTELGDLRVTEEGLMRTTED